MTNGELTSAIGGPPRVRDILDKVSNSSKKGLSSNQLHRSMGITLKSAWFMSHRIRLVMKESGWREAGPLGGAGQTVEADGQEAKTAAAILIFPGTNDAEEAVRGISQRGSVDGEVVRVGGLQTVVPILLRREGEELPGCWAKKSIAKALAHRLFEPVRLFGTGRWNRNDEGKWKLDIFRVESFIPLRDVSLAEALTEIRTIEGDWG